MTIFSSSFRPAVLARTLAGLALMTTLVGCAALENFEQRRENARIPSNKIQKELLRTGKPEIDRATLDRTNARLAAYADPTKPVMHKPGPARSGIVGEVRFAPEDAVGRADPTHGEATETQGQPVEIEFADASLRAIVDFMFETYLESPYTVLPDFEDKTVNLTVQGRYTEKQILRMFEVFLDVHGVTLARKEGIYTVSSKSRGAQLDEAPIGDKTAIWKLDHIDAKQVVPLIRPFLGGSDGIQVLDSLNSLVVTADGAAIAQLDRFLSRIDRSLLEGKDVIIYTPRHLSPQSLVALIQGLPEKLGGDQAMRTILDAEAISARNQVIIVVENTAIKEKVLSFVRGVDQPDGRERKLFHYSVNNQEATDIRQTLNTILPEMLGSREVSIAAHDPTNSLLITATPTDFYEVKKVIDRLDFSVPSVMIDAALVEIQLNEEMRYGIQWFLDQEFEDVLTDVTIDLANPAARGLELGALSLDDNEFALIDLLASETDLEVLARPRIFVKNKREATIETVNELKVISSIETSDVESQGDTGFVREFETREFGVILKVTPDIADDGTVRMEIEIEDSRRGADQEIAGTNQPTFNTRKVITEVVVKNGDSIFIGGLIQQQKNDSVNKIPFLGDIPVVKHAFRNNTKEIRRSELIVFLTPYIVFDQKAAQLISNALIESSHHPAPKDKPGATESEAEKPAPTSGSNNADGMSEAEDGAVGDDTAGADMPAAGKSGASRPVPLSQPTSKPRPASPRPASPRPASHGAAGTAARTES